MHDAFLSYSRHDTRSATRLRARLAAAGVATYLDRHELTPGRPWQPELERALDDCRAVVVLIGAGGLGSWQQREVQVALDKQARDAARLVIPVLLDGAEEPPLFLGLNTWIDLRDPADEQVELDRMLRALRTEPSKTAAPVARPDICPYRALKAFREEDARFFFGRDDIVAEIEHKVNQKRVVAVVGASGSGKSSVVRAGLASRLRQARGEDTWQIVTLLPTDRPLRSLAKAFVPLLDHGVGDVKEMQAAEELEGLLHRSAGALRELVERALENDPGTTRMLLIVDQWEELYTLCDDREVRDRFIAQLLDAACSKAFRCVLTVRGDFMGKVLESAPLVEQLRDAQVNLAPMGVDGLRDAIVEPAKAVGLGFEDGLVERILADVGEEPGNLPLLEFLLYQLWELDHEDGTMSHEPYAQLGGVQGAIAHRAKEILDDKSASERAQLRRVFGRLVRPGEGAEDTRRRAEFGEFASDDERLISELVDARLLVKSTNEAAGHGDGPLTLEVAHEALIRGWPELRRWIDEDRGFLSWRNRLRAAIDEWQQSRRSSDLLTGGRLSEAERWFRERRDQLAAVEVEFIGRSSGRRRRAAFLLTLAVATFTVGMIVAVWLSLDALERQTHATDPSWVRALIARADGLRPRNATREETVANIDAWIRAGDGVLGREDGYRSTAIDAFDNEQVQTLLTDIVELRVLRERVQTRLLEPGPEAAQAWRECGLDPHEHLVPLGKNVNTGLWEFWLPKSGAKPTWEPSWALFGEVQPTPDMALVFVLVEGGSFDMGAQTDKSEAGFDASAQSDEQPIKTVSLSRFFISKYEMTAAQWAKLGGGGAAASKPGHPVVSVGWDDCVDRLAEFGLQLPTEAQWEYACRAGTRTPYAFGETNWPDWRHWLTLGSYAWYDRNSEAAAHPIGAKQPNAWGLHDMHGNVWEWCRDLYPDYEIEPGVADGLREVAGRPSPFHVFRGGSFRDTAAEARSAFRCNDDPPRFRLDSLGLRPVAETTSK